MLSDREFRYLRGKKQISIPSIQSDFSVTYTEAREIWQRMIEDGMLARDPRGLFYEVNVKSVSRSTLDKRKCINIAERITQEQFELMRYMYGNSGGVSRDERNGERLEALVWMKLSHEFDSRYFLSIDESSYKTISTERAKYEYENLDAVYNIAYPIVAEAIRKKHPPHQVAALRMFPDECRRYMLSEYNKYLKTKTLPSDPLHEELTPYGMKFLFIEAFVCAFDFGAHERYADEAKRQLEIIENSSIVPPSIKEGVKFAVDDITNELTYENIREIRVLVQNRHDSDEDDSEGDDW